MCERNTRAIALCDLISVLSNSRSTNREVKPLQHPGGECEAGASTDRHPSPSIVRLYLSLCTSLLERPYSWESSKTLNSSKVHVDRFGWVVRQSTDFDSRHNQSKHNIQP